MNLSRRKLLGGSAALAIAAIAPARGQTFMLKPAGFNTGPVLIDGMPIELTAADLRPGSIYYVSKGQAKLFELEFRGKEYRVVRDLPS